MQPWKNRTSEEEGKSVSLEDSAGGYDAYDAFKERMKGSGERDRGVEEAGSVWRGGKMRRKQVDETDILEMAAGKPGRGLVNGLGCMAAAASP